MSNSSVNTVVLVDAVRTPFGKAGSLFAGTRADDLMVRCMRGLLERNPQVDPKSMSPNWPLLRPSESLISGIRGTQAIETTPMRKKDPHRALRA